MGELFPAVGANKQARQRRRWSAVFCGAADSAPQTLGVVPSFLVHDLWNGTLKHKLIALRRLLPLFLFVALGIRFFENLHTRVIAALQYSADHTSAPVIWIGNYTAYSFVFPMA